MAKPVYALVGDDSFLQLQALAQIASELPPGTQKLDVDGERADLSDVLDELRSFAMFGGGKLVVVRSADPFLTKHREALETYVASPADSATLVLRLTSLPANQRIHKAISKVGEVRTCQPPKNLVQWIVEHGSTAHNLEMTPPAATQLAELIGADLGRLDNELAKLAIESDGKRVGPDMIAGNVAFQREQQMWDMTNELAAGSAQGALRRWRQLLQLDSSVEYRAVTWLLMWLENVRKALALKKRGLAPPAICQQLRIWPRESQGPFMQTAQRLGDAGVAKTINLLAEVDRQSKSGVGDAAGNVERFILQLAQYLTPSPARGG